MDVLSRVSTALSRLRLGAHPPIAQSLCFDRSRPLVFMHIPKTAGTALISGLADALRPGSLVSGFDRSVFGEFQDFSGMEDKLRHTIYLSPTAMPEQAELVAGHISFSSLKRSYGSAQFMTLFREPVSRLLSHWLYWRQQSDDALAGWGSWAERVKQSRQPLASFLASRDIACQTDNMALRLLLWPDKLIPPDDFIKPGHDDRLFHRATKVLGEFGFVDILENTDLNRRLESWIGHPILNERLNQTRFPPDGLRTALDRELTWETHDLLALRSRLDLRLWGHVAGRCMPGEDVLAFRNKILLTNMARFAAIALAAA
jgi:hypothetical protein